MSANRDLAQRFLKRVWLEGESDAIYEMFTCNAVISGLEGVDHNGPEEFHAFHRMMSAQFSDIHHEVHQSVEEGDWVALFCTITAVYRATGAEVKTTCHMMMKFRGDKIAEAHNMVDLLALFECTGRLPPRSADICLAGGRLTLALDRNGTSKAV